MGRAREYLHCVELLRQQLEPTDPLLVTLFSPLGLVGLWCGKQAIPELLAEPRAVSHQVLGALGALVCQLAQECVRLGADGIYYSCWGQDVLTDSEYAEFGVPYDLAGLVGARDVGLRVLHIHGALGGEGGALL